MVSFILAQASGDEPKYLLFLFAWLLGGAIGGYLAERKGYGEKIGIVTGLCLSIIAALIWAVMPPRDNSDWKLKGPWGSERKDAAVPVGPQDEPSLPPADLSASGTGKDKSKPPEPPPAT